MPDVSIIHDGCSLLIILDEIYASMADRTISKLLGLLARYDLLLINELEYLTLKSEQANALFKLMDRRYGRKSSTTTNLCNKYLNNQIQGQGSLLYLPLSDALEIKYPYVQLRTFVLWLRKFLSKLKFHLLIQTDKKTFRGK